MSLVCFDFANCFASVSQVIYNRKLGRQNARLGFWRRMCCACMLKNTTVHIEENNDCTVARNISIADNSLKSHRKFQQGAFKIKFWFSNNFSFGFWGKGTKPRIILITVKLYRSLRLLGDVNYWVLQEKINHGMQHLLCFYLLPL